MPTSLKSIHFIDTSLSSSVYFAERLSRPLERVQITPHASPVRVFDKHRTPDQNFRKVPKVSLCGFETARLE